MHSFILSASPYYKYKTALKKNLFYLYNESTTFYDSLRYGNQSFLVSNVRSFYFAKNNKLTYWIHTFNKFIAIVLTNIHLTFCKNSPLFNQTAYSFWVSTWRFKYYRSVKQTARVLKFKGHGCISKLCLSNLTNLKHPNKDFSYVINYRKKPKYENLVLASLKESNAGNHYPLKTSRRLNVMQTTNIKFTLSLLTYIILFKNTLPNLTIVKLLFITKLLT